MKISELIKGQIYINPLHHKYTPLLFNGIISKVVNAGYNTFVRVATFKPVKTPENEFYFDLYPEITEDFNEVGTSMTFENTHIKVYKV